MNTSKVSLPTEPPTHSQDQTYSQRTPTATVKAESWARVQPQHVSPEGLAADLGTAQGSTHGRPRWEAAGYGPRKVCAVATSARSRWPKPALALPMCLCGLHASAAMAPVITTASK